MSIDRTKYLSLAEEEQFRQITRQRAEEDLRQKHIRGVLAWMVVDLALSTGLRVSEMALIQLKDIDFEREQMTVYRKKKRRPTRYDYPLGPNLQAHLKQYIEWAKLKEGPLLIGARGPLSGQGLQQIWLSAVNYANKHGMRLYKLDSKGKQHPQSIHCARHTFAMNTYYHRMYPKDVVTLSNLLGHDSVDTTVKMYITVPWQDKQNAVRHL